MADADRERGRGPATPQEIWIILREVSDSQKETDRRMQETDRLLKRQRQETDRRLGKLDELFNGQWGKLMEALVEGDLIPLLRQRGIEVERTMTSGRACSGRVRDLVNVRTLPAGASAWFCGDATPVPDLRCGAP